MTSLTPAQIVVLKFVAEYGPLTDFGGRGANRANMNAAKQLIHQGLLSGHYRAACITDAGRVAVSSPERGRT